MKTDYPIFDIPVYRCNLDEHSIEVENTIEDKLNLMRPPLSDRERWKREIRLRYDDAQWMRWHYTQTVGWLQLRVSGMDVQATEFWATAKRITSTIRHKTFIWNSYKAISVIVLPNMNDADIYSEIDKELLTLAKSKKYRKRYIDLTNFHNVGPFIRWQDLLNPNTIE